MCPIDSAYVARATGAAHLEHLGGGGFWNMMRIFPTCGIGVLSMGNATKYPSHELAVMTR